MMAMKISDNVIMMLYATWYLSSRRNLDLEPGLDEYVNTKLHACGMAPQIPSRASWKTFNGDRGGTSEEILDHDSGTSFPVHQLLLRTMRLVLRSGVEDVEEPLSRIADF